MSNVNDYGGLKADRLRVRINFDGRRAGRFLKYGGSIGFKNKDGAWTNRYVDLMIGEGAPEIFKGDTVLVTGRMTIEDREWKGQQKTDRLIWVDHVEVQGQRNPSNAPSNAPSGRDQAGFPTDSSGMSDVPF